MSAEENYLRINKNSWEQRVETHVDSEFYDMKGFLNGATSLKEIELALLPDLKGRSLLHLQCHFGQDTISLARMGASATGVDFSDKAIAKAKEIAANTRCDASFVCCNVYEAPKHIPKKFDVVFTSYGTIGWLPDIKRWAAVVAGFLKPGGLFVFAEFHPVVWMFDNDFKEVKYRYFKSEPIIEDETGTYADRASDINIQSVSWNHGLGEVITALLDQGLEIKTVNEYDYSPYRCFNNMEEFEKGKFRIKGLQNKIPMVYSITARKPI